MARRLIAGLIVVGLAVGVWVLWPRGDSDTTTTTPVPLALATTTSSGVTTSSTSTASTTLPDSHVVTSVEEAEEILRELLYSRFLAIFEEDEVLLQELVASEGAYDSGRDAFGQVGFSQQPTRGAIGLSALELLRADESCMAVWTALDTSEFLEGNGVSSGVVVLRRSDGRWKWMSLWQHKNDLWEADCESLLDSVS